MKIRRFLKETQFLIEYLLLLPWVTLARRLSEGGAKRLSRLLGAVAYRVLRNDKNWALRNLELVFGPNLSRSDRQAIARASFDNIVLTRIESLRWTREWMIDKVIEVNGDQARAVARAARAKGVGTIVVTAHLGNFELLAPWVYYCGFRGPIMYRPQDNWRVERLILGARSAYMPQVVARTAAGFMTLGYALRQGEGVGLAIDINTISSPVFVEFLGYLSASPPGAAGLALTTGAPVIPAVCIRQPDGRYQLIFHPPVELVRTGNRKRDVAANTAQFMGVFEPYIQSYPEQYNWPHPRWRYRPDFSSWRLDTPVDAQSAERLGPPRARLDPNALWSATAPRTRPMAA